MALAMSTARITGRMWAICPVISNASKAVERVWVTEPENAAAPVR